MCMASANRTVSRAEENAAVGGPRQYALCWEWPLDGDSAGSAGKQQNGVVGGGIAIDGDAIERAFDSVVEQIRSDGGFELGIGEKIHQHGGMRAVSGSGLQLRMDHARALRDAGNTNGYPSTRKLAAAIFGRVSVVMMAPAICCR